jgi:hypothetical protein
VSYWQLAMIARLSGESQAALEEQPLRLATGLELRRCMHIHSAAQRPPGGGNVAQGQPVHGHASQRPSAPFSKARRSGQRSIHRVSRWNGKSRSCECAFSTEAESPSPLASRIASIRSMISARSSSAASSSSDLPFASSASTAVSEAVSPAAGAANSAPIRAVPRPPSHTRQKWRRAGGRAGRFSHGGLMPGG